MKFIQTVKDTWKGLKYARSFSSFFDSLSSQNNSKTPSHLDIITAQAQTIGGSNYGVTDNTMASPVHLYDLMQKDSFYSSLIKQLIEALFKNGFYVDVAKDKEGREIGSPVRAKQLEDKLKEHDYEWLIRKQMYGELGDGGGNVLLYPMKTSNGIQFQAEPFLDMACERVKVYFTRGRRIQKYEVLNQGAQVVHTIDTMQNLYVHSRYEEGGDFRFSSNPAKRAVYWYILKKYVAGANTHSFKNGLQEPYLLSPDFSQLKTILEGMNTGKVGGSGNKLHQTDIQAFWRLLAKQTDKTLKSHVGNIRNSGQAIRVEAPLKVDKIGRSNKDMESEEFIKRANKEMAFTLRTPLEMLNPENSKYANAEIGTDNWEKLVLSPLKRKIEQLTMSYYLPIIDPFYDAALYPVRFGRDPDQEDIDSFKAKTERLQAQADILLKVSGLPGVTYNVETNEIEQKQASDAVVVDPGKGKEISGAKKSAYKMTRVKKKETPSEKAINSKDGNKFKSLIEGAITNQLEAYAKKLKRKKTLKGAIKSLEKDMPAVSTTGLPVNTFKQQLEKFARIGVEEFEKTTKEKRMVRQGTRVLIPEEVRSLMDIKAQLMLRGFDSLSAQEQQTILTFYSREYATYAGMDAEVTSQVNTILNDALSAPVAADGTTLGIQGAIRLLLEAIPRISLSQATTISKTEISQAIEATRYNQYTEFWGVDNTEGLWTTVQDSRVREAHRQNQSAGWKSADHVYANGARTPSDEIACRCTMIYRKKKGKGK